MPYSIEITPSGSTLMARLAGALDKEEYLRARAEVVEALKANRCEQILFDLQQAQLKISTLDVFSVASTSSQVIPVGTKYAIVTAPTTIAASEARFGENVAVNRGACLRVFPDCEAALAWLGER